jgi:FtsP/CotA-like multicopper oxidase with cupredoxin domain
MAVEERARTIIEKEQAVATNQDKQPDVVVVTGPYRLPATPGWWNGITSPLGIGIISVIIMVALLSFSIGGSTVNSASSATSSTDSHTSTTASTDASTANVPDATQNIGDQPAKYVVDPDGAKHFTFTAQQVMWEVVKGHRVLAYAINGTVPGPQIRVTANDHIRVTFINHFPEATAVHWHGLNVPSSQDGVPGIGQKPIQPGQTFVYDFTVHDQDVGTHWYHSHYNDMTEVAGGFYGAFIVDPRPGSAQAKQAAHTDIEQDQFIGSLGGYYVINGKSFPDTKPVMMKHGQTVRLRLFGADTFAMHPMHLHGHTFSIVAEDGHPLSQPLQKDTVQVAPGETYDITFTALAAPGSVYPFHCHILSHLMNPGQTGSEMGGLITLIEYAK